MQLSFLFVTGVAAAASSFITARGVDCSFETTADLGATCDDFASSWGLSVDNLKALNPGITCPGLNTNLSYCVIGDVTNETDPSSTKKPGTTPKPSSTPKPTSTPKLTSNTSPTTLKTSSKTSASGSKPTNTMPGLAANCDGWDKVVTNDNCETISKRNGITETQFASYNPQLDSSCSNLWLDYYVCVHGSRAQTTPSPTPTSASSSSPPASEWMPGIVSNCKTFHKVVSGDSCWALYTAAGVTSEQFLMWNTGLDSSCNVWLGYYVCVGV